MDSQTYSKPLASHQPLAGFFNLTDIQKMMEEIVIMQQFNHQNVLRLLGVVVIGLSGPSIVMPFMANGNLSSYLRKNQEMNVLPASADADNVSTSVARQLHVYSTRGNLCLQKRD